MTLKCSLFFTDGQEVNTGSNSDWKVLDEFTIRGDTDVLALNMVDKGWAAGFLLELSNGILSGAQFECVEVTGKEANFATNYIDFLMGKGSFDNPAILGANGVAPWGHRSGVSKEAEWIWLNSNGSPDRVACRVSLG